MAAPQPPYAQPRPGSTTYYTQPPPPPHYYGNQVPAHYQYPYAPSPPMHSPTGLPRNGPYSPHSPARGNYRNYQPAQHHPQHFPHPAYPPPHNLPYSPNVAQHEVPYSPSYPFQQPSARPPAWQSQHQLSPLPKQLAMPPSISPSLHPEPTPLEPEATPQEPPAPESYVEAVANAEPLPSPPLTSSPPAMQQPYASLGSIQTSETDTKPVTSSNETPAESKIGGWAIWSRRPHNPSHAPGIIISPLARPPQIVIDGALEQHTPPPSPKPVVEVQNVAVLKESTPEHTDLPSSSATETTTASSTAPDTPVQGSPLSTNTSVSAVADSSDKSKKSSLSPKVETVQVETIQPPVPKPAPVKKSWASLLRPTDSVASSSKSALPTSSVVGFSIPGVSTQGGVAASSPGRKSELLALLMSAPSGPLGGPPRIQPRGLVNSGNMCFANAVLQVLVYCPQFYRLFTDLGKYLTGPVVGAQAEKGTPLVDATIDFLKEFTPATPPPSDKANGTSKTKGKEVARDDEGGDLDSFIPTNIYEALKEKKRFDSMRGGHQEDAEEFLGFFLDTLEEELLSIANSLNDAENKPDPAVEEHEEAAPPEEDGWLEVGRRNRTVITRTIKSAESPITKIFGGKSRSTLRAPGQKDSVTIEDWRSLRLDIQREQVHTIKDALQYISHPQPVQMTHPSKPGVTIDASQQILIDALPPILILHMKRFLYDTSVRDVVKVGKQVSFTPELDIPSDLMSPTRKLHTTRYKLFGVLYHHGLSASGGHYTLDVLHPNRDLSNKPREAWIRIDDELVSDVRPDDVFGGLDRDDRCAYLLFYRRVGAPRT